MNQRNSFTLIELLVVIAIIGLISSIVLVNFKGTKDKARIAKSLDFSQTVQNALGSEAVGIWNFDEGSDGATLSSAKDSSSYGNNGTCSGATCPTYTSDTPQSITGTGAEKYALSFDGNDYVNCGTNNSLNITGPVTVEAWVYLKSDAPAGNYRSIYYKGSQIWLRVNPGKIAICYFYQGAIWRNVRLKTTLSLNNWYHLVVTYDNTTAKFYVNGVDDTGTKTVLPGGIDSSASTVYISLNSAVNAWNGSIDEVRIYSKALASTQIQKHYTEGLERHQDLVIK